jgi:hypothetical protein
MLLPVAELAPDQQGGGAVERRFDLTGIPCMLGGDKSSSSGGMRCESMHPAPKADFPVRLQRLWSSAGLAGLGVPIRRQASTSRHC